MSRSSRLEGFLRSAIVAVVFCVLRPAATYAQLYEILAHLPGTGASSLTLASDGNFYGVETSAGGPCGDVFRIDPVGNVSIFHSFTDGADGCESFPVSPVVEWNGYIYGTTTSDGDPGSVGTVFRMDYSRDQQFGALGAIEFVFARTPVVLRLFPTAGPVLVRPGDPVQIHGGIFPVGEVPSVLIGGLPASSVQLLDQENITAATPPDLAPGTLNEIIIVLPDGTQASLEKAWMADFLDVPESDRRHGFVERVFRAGLMDGCEGGNFCEAVTIDRAALVTMALKAKLGPAWAPPACTGVFKDVACPGPQADWVEDAVAEGIAQPCGRDKFCPDLQLTRDEEPAILLKTEHGSDYVPPSCRGVFKDVKCPGPKTDAIEQAHNEGVVSPCSTNPLRYCPIGRVERGALAESAAKSFRLS